MLKHQHPVHFNMETVSIKDTVENATYAPNPNVEITLTSPPLCNHFRSEVRDFSEAELKVTIVIIIVAMAFLSCFITWLIGFALH